MDIIDYVEVFHSDCLQIIKKKNADYTHGSSDPFANFKAVAAIGIDPVEGVLTRMMDKMARISSFHKNGELQVKDESVHDTLVDLANYAALLSAMITEKQTK